MYRRIKNFFVLAVSNTRRYSRVVFLAGITGVATVGASIVPEATEAQQKKRPNIVLIVADDMGFSDLGIYGSEISTSRLDSLAKEGMVFTNFHTSASCSPTRSMMMSGVDNHYAGLGNMLEKLSPNQKGKPGYEGFLNDKVVTLATLLKDSGYHTYMAGKWHLGGAEFDEETGEQLGFRPYERGFEETFAMLEGGGDHHSRRGFSKPRPINTWTRNGEPIEELPDGFYSTTGFTDQMIEFIDAKQQDDKPFFAYLSYTAPHSPYQAPDEYIQKYLKTYEKGWDKVRAERFERMKQLGLIPDYLELPPRWEEAPAWEELGDKQKISVKKMAIYAAMIDYMDMSIGRVIDYVKRIGEYNNTIFVFVSDNGADGHNREEDNTYDQWFEEIGVDNSYENMGRPNSFVTRNVGWAQVSGTPNWSEKATLAEGGIHGAFFIAYPGVIDPGGRSDAFASVLDVTPTLLDYAGIQHPGTSYKGRKIYPMNGKSMRPLWEGWADRIYGENEPVSFEVFGLGMKAVFMGDWKAVVQLEPWGNGRWQLFNLKIDQTEVNDLSRIYPDLLKQMVEAYEEYEKDVGYVPAKP